MPGDPWFHRHDEFSRINWIIVSYINGVNLRSKPLPLFGFLATRWSRVAKKPLKTNPEG